MRTPPHPLYSLQNKLLSIAPVLALAVLIQVSQAANLTWSSTGSATPGGDGNWSGGSTWWNNTSGVAWTSGDNATFSAAGNTTVNSAVTAGTLTINSSTANINILPGAGDLTLTGGITATNSANTTALVHTIGTNIILGGNLSVSSIQGGTVGTTNLLLSGNLSGAFGITKSGNSNLTLNGTNSYTGQTRISNGNINVYSLGNFSENSSFGRGSAGVSIIVGSGATAGTIGMTYLGSGSTSNRTFQIGNGNGTSSATISSSGTGALVFTASAFNTADTGSVIGFSNRTLTLAGSNTGNNEIQGAVIDNTNGTVSIVKSSSGTWVLSGNNTYTGATRITGGTLQIGNGGSTGSLSTSSAITNNATLVFNRSNTITQGTDFASVIDGTGAIRQDGAGILVLSGANTYTGATTVSNGTMQITHANALGGTGNGTTVSSGATLALSGNITTTGETLSLSGTGAGGGGALRSLSETNSWNATITLLADTTIGSDSGTLNLIPGTGTITASNFNLTLTGAGNFNIARQIALGTGGLTMNGTGTFTMGTLGSSAYTGTTTINSGTLTLGNSNRINDSSALVVNGGRFKMDTFSESVAGVTLAGGNITSTTGVLTSTSDYNLQNGAITAVMAGSVGVNKSTGGTVTLSAANTYTGATLVSAGTLIVNGSTGASSAVTVDAGATLGGSGTVNGTATINGILSPGTASTLTLGATLTLGSGSTLALTLGSSSSKIAFSSAADNLIGSGNAALSLTQGAGFDYNTTYRIFENTNTTGFTFSSITGYDTAVYTANFAKSGSNYDLSFTAVPEPSTYALLLTGLAAIFFMRRRRVNG